MLPEGHQTWEYKENFWRGKTGQSLRNMAFSVVGQTFNDGESFKEIFRFPIVFFSSNTGRGDNDRAISLFTVSYFYGIYSVSVFDT